MLLTTAARAQQVGGLGFDVPGFEVSLYADDSLATDIFCLTIDAKGRVVVASKGYVKVLHDDDGDGKADRATVFADMPRSGAHGMYFDGPDLIVVGDKGVRRLADTDGDGRCDHISPPWIPAKNDSEHAANGIVKGPDGWYYLICGNDAGIGPEHAKLPGSPVKQPNSGAVVRISPDGKHSEVVAHGFRNPYDLAFNHLGQLFTVDADGERIHQMPYYAPTRLFDIATGMHHGWLLSGWVRAWSRPPCWPDNVERLVEIGRGSPTGVIVYRHHAFPKRYRGGVFSLCWTFGRLYHFPLEPNGSTYTSRMETFMKTTGDVGFAPTDMAVGPDGDLFIAIGGRGTRGSVFRVRYVGPREKEDRPTDPVRAVLTADEPLSSWSRARWVPQAKKLGRDAFVAATLDARLPSEERIRAVEVLTELFGGVPIDATTKIAKGSERPELVARVLWSVSRGEPSSAAYRLIATATATADPWVARAAWETLAGWPTSLPADVSPDWHKGLGQADRRVRAAALLAARGPGRASYDSARGTFKQIATRHRLAELWIRGASDAAGLKAYVTTCLDACESSAEPSVRLEAVRLLQVALGDVTTADGPDRLFVGYAPQTAGRVNARLRAMAAAELAGPFPTGDADLDREMARLFGMLGEDVPGLPGRIATRWSSGTTPKDDIHYLLVLARLPGERSADTTQRTARALNGIFTKLAAEGARPTDQVPALLESLFDKLMERDPALAAALATDPSFGAVGHELYANRLPPAQKQTAARKLLGAIDKLGEDEARAAWSPDLVRLAASLPEAEALPILRAQFRDPRLSDPIALILAEQRHPEDRVRLVEALSSTQGQVVAAAANALVGLANPDDKAPVTELATAIRSLRRVAQPPGDLPTGKSLLRLLARRSGQPLAADVASPAELTRASTAWSDWLVKAYPKEAPSLLGMTGADATAWRKRLANVDWSVGEVKRGEVVFQRKSCFRCHGEARRLGPDLAGAAQRFSRDDLFVAIFDPSKDIAPAYVPKSIVTNSGKTYSGMIIYESPALTLLQTTPDTTVRIPGSHVQSIQPSRVSFMPTGLIDDLADGEIADLYAYLQSLRKK
jgi:putative membrane-bound dehydrogenase-like protein